MINGSKTVEGGKMIACSSFAASIISTHQVNVMLFKLQADLILNRALSGLFSIILSRQHHTNGSVQNHLRYD